MDRKEFAINLRVARVRKRLTQTALGKLVGCNQVQISGYENIDSGVTPSKGRIESLAKALDVEVVELTGDMEEEELLELTTSNS